jgi:hypothetical protein
MTYSGRTLRRLAFLRSSIAIKTRMYSRLFAWAQLQEAGCCNWHVTYY